MQNMITVLIVNYNSSDFVDLNLYALLQLTKNKYQVFILDNNSKKNDYLRLKEIVQKYKNVFLERNKTDLRGSMAHGTALNKLVKKVSTPYFCIIDADVCWLKKNWDEILINELRHGCKIIGTQYLPPKYTDFPTVFACLFETKTFRALNVDLRPRDVADKMQCDTAYELKNKYLAAGLSGKILIGKNTRNNKQGLYKDVICVEYYHDDDLIACHFGRGSTQGITKYYAINIGGLKLTIPLVSPIIARYFGFTEKIKWIKISTEIINYEKNKLSAGAGEHHQSGEEER